MTVSFQRLGVLLLFLSFFCFMHASMIPPRDNKMQPRDLPVVGGYAVRDCNDPGVQSAAHFAVNLFVSENIKDFVPTSDITYKVYKAAMQVVAGLNYKLSIMTYIQGTCQGALEDVIIYRDLNQVYSVREWGMRKQCDEITCSHVCNDDTSI